METNIVVISPPISYLANFKFLMLSANQIAGFFKVQYLKKEVNYELCFLHAYKHQSLVQVDTIILGVCNQACPKYPK